MHTKSWSLQGTMVHVYEDDGHRCRLCGQYFKENEQLSLVFMPTSSANFFVHEAEWVTFIENRTDEEILAALEQTKQPKAKNGSMLSNEEIQAYKEVIQEHFFKVTETRTRIYFKRSRGKNKEARWYVDKRFGTVHFSGQDNQLFSGMFQSDFKARLHEAWQKKLGKPVQEGFRVEKAMKEVMEDVDKLMGK